MKPIKNDRRLSLQRESLRPLDRAMLHEVRGGVLGSIVSTGPTKACDPPLPPNAVWQ
jgi:hypothetical protein